MNIKRVYFYLIIICSFAVLCSCEKSVKMNPPGQNKSLLSDTNYTSEILITDFENGVNHLNYPYSGDIYGYTDEHETPQGTSTILELIKFAKDSSRIIIADTKSLGALNSNRFLKISGKITTSFPYGFAGCGFNFEKNRQAIDISAYKGLKFWAKGSNDYFYVKIESSLNKEKAFYQFKFFADSTWKDITVFFKNLKQPDWKKSFVDLDSVLKFTVGIQWQTTRQPIKNYLFCVDNVEFIK